MPLFVWFLWVSIVTIEKNGYDFPNDAFISDGYFSYLLMILLNKNLMNNINRYAKQ